MRKNTLEAKSELFFVAFNQNHDAQLDLDHDVGQGVHDVDRITFGVYR